MREHYARESADDLCEGEKLVSTDLNPGARETSIVTLEGFRDVLNPPSARTWAAMPS